jgi:hypothetical protein
MFCLGLNFKVKRQSDEDILGNWGRRILTLQTLLCFECPNWCKLFHAKQWWMKRFYLLYMTMYTFFNPNSHFHYWVQLVTPRHEQKAFTTNIWNHCVTSPSDFYFGSLPIGRWIPFHKTKKKVLIW